MRVGCSWIVGVALIVCGCASIPPLPREGGPAWLELRSAHITLWTDASATRARPLIREIEQRREIILSAMRGGAAANGIADRTQLVVIALRDWLEAGEYGANRPWGTSSLIGVPGFLISADRLSNQALNHQLAHALSFALVPRQPLWLQEGIAAYFEAFELVRDGAGAVFGMAPGAARRYFNGGYPTPVADVLACSGGRCQDAAFNATSWALFSYLAHHHPRAVDRYMSRFDELARGQVPSSWFEREFDTSAHIEQVRAQTSDPAPRWSAQAWRDAFPELSPDELDRKLRDWLPEDKLHVVPLAARPAQVAFTERTLGDADVLAIRGWMSLAFTDEIRSGRADIEAALARDPTNVLARLAHAVLTHAIALDDARATVAAHPDDWRALRLVEYALYGTREGIETVARVCAMSSNTAPECRAPPRAPAAPGQ